MSQERLSKLNFKTKKLELQIQGLNSEIGLKELEIKEAFKEINSIKNRNIGVLNQG